MSVRRAQNAPSLSIKRQDGGAVQGLPMNPLAQQEMGSGVNPAAPAAAPQAALGAAPADPKKIETFFKTIRSTPINRRPDLFDEAMTLSESSEGELKNSLEVLANSLKFNSNPQKLSRRWVTVEQAINEVKAKMKTTPNNSTPAASNKPAQQSGGGMLQPLASRTAGHGDIHTHDFAAQAPHGKKKTRGNPFRVLMGKVGKLLDHGASEHDIVRFLLKDGIFDEATIRKSIDIVKDYNRDKMGDKPEEDGEETDEFYHKAESFNLRRHSARNDSGEANSLYDAKPDFNFRSTSELFSRLRWLESLQSYGKTTPQGDGREAADKKGVKGEIDDIKSALRKRGFSDQFIKADSA